MTFRLPKILKGDDDLREKNELPNSENNGESRNQSRLDGRVSISNLLVSRLIEKFSEYITGGEATPQGTLQKATFEVHNDEFAIHFTDLGFGLSIPYQLLMMSGVGKAVDKASKYPCICLQIEPRGILENLLPSREELELDMPALKSARETEPQLELETGILEETAGQGDDQPDEDNDLQGDGTDEEPEDIPGEEGNFLQFVILPNQTSSESYDKSRESITEFYETLAHRSAQIFDSDDSGGFEHDEINGTDEEDDGGEAGSEVSGRGKRTLDNSDAAVHKISRTS